MNTCGINGIKNTQKIGGVCHDILSLQFSGGVGRCGGNRGGRDTLL